MGLTIVSGWIQRWKADKGKWLPSSEVLPSLQLVREKCSPDNSRNAGQKYWNLYPRNCFKNARIPALGMRQAKESFKDLLPKPDTWYKRLILQGKIKGRRGYGTQETIMAEKYPALDGHTRLSNWGLKYKNLIRCWENAYTGICTASQEVEG